MALEITIPPTITPIWGTWFFKWLDEPDPWEAFFIWRSEMYGDYEWFEDWCDGDEYDVTETIDWYAAWCKQSKLVQIQYELHRLINFWEARK
jgi:hypothetical protein